jgi:hypothetical protein
MMRFPLLCVATLLGLAVSLSAQDDADAIARRSRSRLPFDCAPQPFRPHFVPAVFPQPRFLVPQPCPPQPRGYWQTVTEQVLVPGCWREEVVPPTYGWVRNHCGRLEWAIVQPGGCRRIWVPARYETRTRQVWVPCDDRRGYRW